MTAIEVLERAISKLDQLRDGHSAYGSHPWHEEAHEGSGYATRVISADGYPVPGCFNCGDNEGAYEGTDAALIVALSRTVDPLISMHRRSLILMKRAIGSGMSEADVETIAESSGELAVARAILGEENDHDR